MIKPMAKKILVVDDDASHRTMLKAVLAAEGYQVEEADDGDSACRRVEEDIFDLVLMDLRMRRMDGDVAQKKMAITAPHMPVIIMTAYGTVRSAVQALKAGAHHYLTKPIDVDEMKILVVKALDHHRLEEENRTLKERLNANFDFAGNHRPQSLHAGALRNPGHGCPV